MAEPTPVDIDQFIHRWKNSAGHERGAEQRFVIELCTFLDLPTHSGVTAPSGGRAPILKRQSA